jgi:hypothetical protein
MAFLQECSDLQPDPPLARAMERLASLYEGPQSVVDVVRFGSAAIPSLRHLLLRREKSGLHQARCRAGDALASLGAYEVLDEYLRTERSIVDPIERLGEETVMSAAARALARRPDKRTFELLENLALRRPLTGVLIALGSFKRTKTIPVFVRALAEDEVRLTAEAVLRTFGSRARPYLLSAACESQDEASPSESGLRRRRSALGLLGEFRSKNSDWPSLKPLLASKDLESAILAAGLGLKTGDADERSNAVKTLRRLRIQADWLRRMQIDQYLQRFASKRKRELRSDTAGA